MTDEKLCDIETVLAHHESQIHDLSEMVGAQWKEIEAMKRRLDKAQAKLDDFEAGSREAAQDAGLSVSEIAARDKPPHY